MWCLTRQWPDMTDFTNNAMIVCPDKYSCNLSRPGLVINSMSIYLMVSHRSVMVLLKYMVRTDSQQVGLEVEVDSPNKATKIFQYSRELVTNLIRTYVPEAEWTDKPASWYTTD